MLRQRKCADRHGFTFVELLTALALFSILIVIAWGKFNKSYERALRATMITDLRNLATAEELYWRTEGTYTTDIGSLEMPPSPRSSIYITDANAGGWAAWNEIQRSPEQCELYIGSTVTPAKGIASASERIECGVP